MAAKKIKVTINKTVYYDHPQDEPEVYGKNPTAQQLAAYDKHLFQEGDIDWEDLFSREDVEFEGVEDEDN